MAKEEAAVAPSVKKFPELESLKVDLEKERDRILKGSEPLHRERDALVAKIQPLEAQLREVDLKIRKAERPRLGEINRQLAGIAKALPTNRSMSQSEAK